MLQSARFRRRIRYASVFGGIAAAVAGIIVLVGNHPTTNIKPSDQAAQLVKPEIAVPKDPESIRIGREFIETAVLRKNLNWAYDHAHPYLKGQMTRAQWDRGTIPVIPFPANNAATAEFLVQYSFQTEVLFDVDLVARPGSGVRPHLDFYIGLRRAGDRPTGRWLVSYWEPNWKPPVPVTP